MKCIDLIYPKLLKNLYKINLETNRLNKRIQKQFKHLLSYIVYFRDYSLLLNTNFFSKMLTVLYATAKTVQIVVEEAFLFLLTVF